MVSGPIYAQSSGQRRPKATKAKAKAASSEGSLCKMSGCGVNLRPV